MEKIGKYQILEKLGQGGMGVVYKALDTLIERVVAVKMLASNLDADPELRARFFREGRSAGRLSHKNIVTIFDLGEDHGTAYIAMEFLEGEDLRAKISRGEPMDLRTKVRLILEVCGGLAHAHERNVVHRDIKPANIFINTAGQAKILDFGLARTTASDLTTSGHALGTPNYMSPEQVRGEKVDYRTDIFSVGVLFYELLTYKKAFQGDSFASTIFKILQDEPQRIETFDPDIPPELCAVVYKALAKDRNQRYQTLGDMLQDLINYCGVAGIRVDIEMAERTPVRAGGSEIGSDPKAAATGAGIGSTPPRSLTPAPAGSRTPVNITISDRHGGASGPRDPRARPPSTPSGTDDETTQVEGIQQAPARSPSIRRIAAGLGSVLILASIVWLFAHNRGRNMRSTDDARPAPVSTAPVTETPPAPAQEAKKDLPAANREPKTKQMLAKASEALRAHRYAEAASAATEVLKESPDDVEARSILQNSRNSLDLLRKGVRQARSYLAAGNYEKANSALAEALAIDPSDSEALQLGGQITQSARRAAEQAMVKAKDARSKADAVEAATFAARTWAAAQAADAESSRLLGQGRHADAAAKAAEAAGLYAGAEREARAESAANAERVRLAAMERQQSQLRTRSEASRQTYERVRDSAIQSGAQEKAKEQFAEAEQTAGNARAKLDGGNLDGAAKDYEAAASAMQQARNSAIEAVRKEGSRAISPPKPAPTAAVPQPAAEAHESAEAIQKAIYGVPEQYKAAMEGKNVDLLKSLWPALTPQQEQAYRNQWAYTRSLRMVANNSKIEQIQGDSAVLSVQFHNEQEINNGTRRKWDQKATFRLARKGRAWFIESLSFEELR